MAGAGIATGLAQSRQNVSEEAGGGRDEGSANCLRLASASLTPLPIQGRRGLIRYVHRNLDAFVSQARDQHSFARTQSTHFTVRIKVKWGTRAGGKLYLVGHIHVEIVGRSGSDQHAMPRCIAG